MKPATSNEIGDAVLLANSVLEPPDNQMAIDGKQITLARALLTLFTVMSESKQAAWRLCTKTGTPVAWAKITDIDPDKHETKARANADRMAPADAPHVWEPLFAMRATLPAEPDPAAGEVKH